MKKLMVTLLAATMLAAGGFVAAAVNTSTPVAAQETDQDVEDRTEEFVRPIERPHPGGELIEAAAEALGLTVDELRDAMRDGQTIAGLAEANGVDPAGLIEELTTAATEHLRERFDAMLEALPERIEDFVNRTAPARPENHGFHGPRGSGGHLDELAEVLGLDPQVVHDGLRAGDSIADIAAANGVDLETVIAGLVAAASEHIDEALADGRIDEARAAAAKEQLEARVRAMVEGEGPAFGNRGRRGSGHFDHHGKRHGGFGPGADEAPAEDTSI